MVQDQKDVIQGLEKEINGELPMDDTGSEEILKINNDIDLNKKILAELRPTFTDLIDSQMRTEADTDTGHTFTGRLLELLWKQFVTGGIEGAQVDASKVDSEALEQLLSSGIITRTGDCIKLVNFTCNT